MEARLLAAAAAMLVVGLALGYLAASGAPAAETQAPPPAAAETVTVRETVTSTVASPVTVTVSTVETVTRLVTETTTAVRVEAKLSLVDALGREVVVEARPSRIVVLAPSITETVCMLGQCGRVVGADSFSLNVEGLPGNVTDVGGYWQPDPEKIISLKPDLVLACSGVPAQERLARLLEQHGVTLFFTRCDRSRDWSDIMWDVRSVALLLGVPEKGEEIISWMESVLSNVSAAVANETRPSVALAVYFDEKGVWVSGGGTFQDTMIATAGGVNVFSRLHGWAMVSYEDILAADPDYIVATKSDPAAANATLAAAASTPIGETRAYREGRFCIVYGDYVNMLNRPSPRAVLGAQLLVSILHPGAIEPPAADGGVLCSQPQRGG